MSPAENFDRRRFALLERIARGAPLPEVLEGIVRLIEDEGPGVLGSILLVDEGGCVRRGAAPNLPADFIDRLDGQPIGPRAGSCGAAAHLGQLVVVEDIATHPYWADYAALALPHGLRACWSSPIKSPDGDVLGTFAMYHRERRGPHADELARVDAATDLASIAILRERNLASLQRSEALATRLARLYAVASGVGDALVRIREPRLLYERACRIPVEQQFARLAWIGLLAPDGRLVPAARFGVDDGYVDQVAAILRGVPHNRGPAARAVTTGEPATSNDIASDADFRFRDEALARGLRSCAVFPLTVRGRSIGVLAFYADRPGFFGAEEVRVLRMLAEDVSFAIESLQGEDERQQLVRDLGARVRELGESEERFRAVIEHTPNVGVQCYDASARLTFVNRASLALFGWSSSQVLGRTRDELNFSRSEARRFAEAITQVAETGRPFGPEEFRFRRPDGSDGVLFSTIFPIPATGGATHYVCMDVDLTAHRRMEEFAQASEILRSVIFRSVGDVLFYLGVEPNHEFRFLSVNPSFLRATGLTEDQVIGRSVRDVIPEPSLATVLERYRRAMTERRPVSWEEVSDYPAGRRHGEVTIAPIFDDEGRCTHLLGTVHDVTERMRAETQRRELESRLNQTQRLQSLGTFAGGIAHDFNNILTAIGGHADLAAMDLGEHPGARESLREIRAATERAADLVRQLLTFSRHDEPRRQVLSIEPIVRETMSLLRATLPPAVRVRIRIDSSTPLVRADATQVHQVLMNLGANAAHAMTQRGSLIEVSIEPATIGGESGAWADAPPIDLAPGLYTRLTFTDDGGGMDEATSARAFEPFFTTRASGQGTGLGLSVVHGILQSHGGGVAVDSVPGRGTTFRLYFPAASHDDLADRADPHAAGADADVNGNGEHIVYVDDEEALLVLAKRTLGRLGYRVTAYANPVQALTAIRAHPESVDALVTDLAMPMLSGAELAREAAVIRGDLPIVMLSGRVRSEDAAAARQVGADVLLKPYSTQELARTLKRRLLHRTSKPARN